MGLLDNVKAAAAGVTQKVSGNVDLMGINSQINAAEKEINELFLKLGAAYFEAHKNDPDDALKDQMAVLVEKEKALADLRNAAQTKKAETAAVSFAPPPTPAQSVGQSGAAPAAAGVTCPHCGAPNQPGKFCARCGKAVAGA
ncbi:MAG: hypothetical protein K5686_06875 [Lachnospiraceae bacterium]|nr:hypothetical protein [Lachnospiraceae bacterium]